MTPGTRLALRVLAVILLLTGLLAGGCNLVFLPTFVSALLNKGDYSDVALTLWTVGAALCGAGLGPGLWLYRRTRPPPAKEVQ